MEDRSMMYGEEVWQQQGSALTEAEREEFAQILSEYRLAPMPGDGMKEALYQINAVLARRTPAPAEDINRLSLDVIQIAESALYWLTIAKSPNAVKEAVTRLEQIIQRVDQTTK
jgi:hypothetical protein